MWSVAAAKESAVTGESPARPLGWPHRVRCPRSPQSHMAAPELHYESFMPQVHLVRAVVTIMAMMQMLSRIHSL